MDLTSFDALNRVKQLNAVPKELAESLGLNIAPGTPAHNHAAESKKQWRSPAVEDVLNAATRNKSERTDAMRKLLAQTPAKTLLDRAAERFSSAQLQAVFTNGLIDSAQRAGQLRGGAGGPSATVDPCQVLTRDEELLGSDDEKPEVDLAAVGLRAFLGVQGGDGDDDDDIVKIMNSKRNGKNAMTAAGPRASTTVKNMYRGHINPNGTAAWDAVLVERNQTAYLYDPEAAGRQFRGHVHKSTPGLPDERRSNSGTQHTQQGATPAATTATSSEEPGTSGTAAAVDAAGVAQVPAQLMNPALSMSRRVGTAPVGATRASISGVKDAHSGQVDTQASTSAQRPTSPMKQPTMQRQGSPSRAAGAPQPPNPPPQQPPELPDSISYLSLDAILKRPGTSPAAGPTAGLPAHRRTAPDGGGGAVSFDGSARRGAALLPTVVETEQPVGIGRVGTFTNTPSMGRVPSASNQLFVASMPPDAMPWVISPTGERKPLSRGCMATDIDSGNARLHVGLQGPQSAGSEAAVTTTVAPAQGHPSDEPSAESSGVVDRRVAALGVLCSKANSTGHDDSNDNKTAHASTVHESSSMHDVSACASSGRLGRAVFGMPPDVRGFEDHRLRVRKQTHLRASSPNLTSAVIPPRGPPNNRTAPPMQPCSSQVFGNAARRSADTNRPQSNHMAVRPSRMSIDMTARPSTVDGSGGGPRGAASPMACRGRGLLRPHASTSQLTISVNQRLSQSCSLATGGQVSEFARPPSAVALAAQYPSIPVVEVHRMVHGCIPSPLATRPDGLAGPWRAPTPDAPLGRPATAGEWGQPRVQSPLGVLAGAKSMERFAPRGRASAPHMEDKGL